MKNAFQVSPRQMGLSVSVGLDGVWLHFHARGGKHLAINMDNYYAEAPTRSRLLAAWLDDMRSAAGAAEAARPVSPEFDDHG